VPFGLDDSKEVGFYFALSQVGLEMVAPIGLGWGLDYAFGWGPWGIISGAVLGLVGGMLHLVNMLNRREEEQKRPPRQDTP